MLLVEVADLILLTYSTLHALHATLQSLKYTKQLKNAVMANNYSLCFVHVCEKILIWPNAIYSNSISLENGSDMLLLNCSLMTKFGLFIEH